MKNIFIITIVSLLTILSAVAQSPIDFANSITSKSQIDQMPQMVATQTLALFSQQKNISPQKQQEILSQIDYSTYKELIQEVFVKNFSTEELKTMNNFLSQGKETEFQEMISSINPILYETGSFIGKDISKKILALL